MQLNKAKIIRIIGGVILVLMIMFSSSIKEKVGEYKFEKKPRETVYCHFENNDSSYNIERTQCINIKYVSKEIERINFTSFESFNYTSYFCSSYVESIPDCHTENYYMAEVPLNVWMESPNNTIDGYACIEYQINFSSKNDPSKVMTYLSAFMQRKFDNFSEQRNYFIECDGGGNNGMGTR